MSTPRNFPGLHGAQDEGIPSFLALEGLPVHWQHQVARSRPVELALHHASLLPAATAEAREVHLAEIELAERTLYNAIETIERIRNWSLSNLGLAPPKADTDTPPDPPAPTA